VTDGLQARLEQSAVGRSLISAFVLVTLVVVVTMNLPYFHDSELKRVLTRVEEPYVQLTGLEQEWALFAPNPLMGNSDFRAVVTFADGSKTTWVPPRYDPFLGSFRAGRWAKIVEVMRQDEYSATAFPSFARWVADKYADHTPPPVTVTFVRTVQDLPPPGTDQPQPWRTEAYYELSIADAS
jgi:hypothetical protein